MFILFSRPGCGPCAGVRAALTRRRIPFETRDISTDKEGRAQLEKLGYQTVPVVLNEETGEHFLGQLLNDHLGSEATAGDDRAA